MSTAPGTPGARAELALVALALTLLVVVVLVLTDGVLLLTRPFWVDELLAVMIANRPTPFHVLGDLGSGADGGASLLHVGLWVLRVIAGSLSPTLVRLLSLACVLGALIVLYAVLRRRFDVTSSVAGILATGANALVIEHSYEGRFYGPWLLLCALLAWLLARRLERPGRASAIALAAVAVALCTIHFYGVITLLLMAGAATLAREGRWRERVGALAPVAFGLVAMLVVAPLAIAQRVAYSVPSWLPDFRVAQLAAMLSDFWLAIIPLAGALAIIVVMIVRRVRGERDRATSIVFTAARDPGIAAIAALALLPLVLAVLSLIGQPSMLARYAVPATLVWGVWMALACALSGRLVSRLAIPLLAWFWFVGYTREVRAKSSFVQALAIAAQSYQQGLMSHTELPIVFTSSNVMYPVVALVGGASRARYLDIPDSTFRRLFPDHTPLGQANRITVLERDLARVHARRLGFPRMLDRAAAETLPRFLLLLPPGRVPPGTGSIEQFAKNLFPRHQLRRLGTDLSMLERSASDASSGNLPAVLQNAAQSDRK